MEAMTASSNASSAPILAWHYTLGVHLLRILESGYVLPQDTPDTPVVECPVAWFSLNQQHDPSALKSILVNGKPQPPTLAVMRQLGNGVYRLGISPRRLLGGEALRREARRGALRPEQRGLGLGGVHHQDQHGLRAVGEVGRARRRVASGGGELGAGRFARVHAGDLQARRLQEAERGAHAHAAQADHRDAHRPRPPRSRARRQAPGRPSGRQAARRGVAGGAARGYTAADERTRRTRTP